MGSCDIVSNVREKVNSDQMLNPCSTKPRTFGATSSGGFLLTNSVKFIVFVLMVIWNAYLLLNWSRLQKNNRGCILVTDASYYKMPQLFQLDDYETCMANQGVYCRGTFQLVPGENVELLYALQNFSSDKLMYDHTKLRRGYCISSKCENIKASSDLEIFNKCMAEYTEAELDLSVLTLESECFTDKPVVQDTVDLIFTCSVVFLVICNIFGTIYDMLQKDNKKRNKFLIAWSLKSSWNRLTSFKEVGNPKLRPLLPLDGIKCFSMQAIIMAHVLFLYYATYMYNPQMLEEANSSFKASFFANGSVVVQTFIMMSSFIFAYTVLVNNSKNPERGYGFGAWIHCLLQRYARMAPVYLFAIGLAATWWRHAYSGPQWNMLVGAQAKTCRELWWWQFLFVHNFANEEQKCQAQTWYIAVEMQLFLLVSTLTFMLVKTPRRAVVVLPLMVAVATVANFIVSYIWDLKSLLFIRNTEKTGVFVGGDRSFNWFYTAPWGSLPESLIGIFNAFLYFQLQKHEVDLKKYKLFRVAYYISLPMLILWLVPGHWLQHVRHPLFTAGYNAIIRVGFVIIVSVTIFGLFYRISEGFTDFLAWRGWQILSRLSLSVLMLHLGFVYWLNGIRFQPMLFSYVQAFAEWIFLTIVIYLASVPVCLLVEIPCRNFLAELINLVK